MNPLPNAHESCLNTARASQPSSPAAVVKARRRIWPYIVGTAVFAGAGSAWYCHHLWTAPIPDTMSDESSAMGEMIVLFLLGVGVIVCTVMGALLGWLIGWIVRTWSPLSGKILNT